MSTLWQLRSTWLPPLYTSSDSLHFPPFPFTQSTIQSANPHCIFLGHDQSTPWYVNPVTVSHTYKQPRPLPDHHLEPLCPLPKMHIFLKLRGLHNDTLYTNGYWSRTKVIMIRKVNKLSHWFTKTALKIILGDGFFAVQQWKVLFTCYMTLKHGNYGTLVTNYSKILDVSPQNFKASRTGIITELSLFTFAIQFVFCG